MIVMDIILTPVCFFPVVHFLKKQMFTGDFFLKQESTFQRIYTNRATKESFILKSQNDVTTSKLFQS